MRGGTKKSALALAALAGLAGATHVRNARNYPGALSARNYAGALSAPNYPSALSASNYPSALSAANYPSALSASNYPSALSAANYPSAANYKFGMSAPPGTILNSFASDQNPVNMPNVTLPPSRMKCPSHLTVEQCMKLAKSRGSKHPERVFYFKRGSRRHF